MPDAPAFIFGIPLIARSAAYDWDVVVHHFNATLGSIFNQTDPNFRVIVACTGRPEVRITVDDRLEFVDVPEEPFVEGIKARFGDITRRRAAILDRAAAAGGADVMVVDADDLVSDRLVAYVRSRDHPFGHLVTKGYAFDSKRGLLSEIPTKEGRSISFHYVCGTSYVLRLTAQEMREAGEVRGFFRRVLSYGHADVGRLSIVEGRQLDLIPFRAVVYVRNHGSNMSERPDLYSEAVRAYRFRLVEGIAKSPVPLGAALATEFNLGALTAGKVVGSAPDVPTLTIAITTCRRAAGLRQLLDALRPQIEEHDGRELVVVNDGSHDADYARVVEEFEGLARYEALPENVGVGAARNRAAALAKGRFVVFVDDDCVPPPFWVDWLSARLSAEPSLDVLAGTTRLLWRNRGFFERVQAHFQMLPRPWATSQDIIFVTANVAIRRELLERLGGFRPLRIGEDSELAGRIALAGARVTFDEDWYVRHEPEPFRTKLRKYWRYGFTNVALHERTTVPVAFANLLQARRRLHVRKARFNYRRAMAEADGFSKSRASRLAAVLAVTCVQIAYYDGCAAGARSRRTPPPA